MGLAGVTASSEALRNNNGDGVVGTVIGRDGAALGANSVVSAGSSTFNPETLSATQGRAANAGRFAAISRPVEETPMRAAVPGDVNPKRLQLVKNGKSQLKNTKIWLSKSAFNRHIPYGIAFKFAQQRLFRSMTPNALMAMLSGKNQKQLKSFTPERIEVALKSFKTALESVPALDNRASWHDALAQVMDALKPVVMQWSDEFPILNSDITDYETLGLDFLTEFFSISQAFMERVQAHPVDKNLNNHDKGRALTNVWAQLLTAYVLEKPCELTDDLYAISIAYPHHDDLLDDNAISNEQKNGIIKQVFQILKTGEMPDSVFSPREESEKRLYSLVQDIHAAHSHCDNCGALPSVAALNGAQKLSGVQKDARTERLPFEVRRNIWETLLTKGAATTVADAYLSFHRMNEEEFTFAGLTGMFGQLIKDIEDIDEDVENGEHTAARISYEHKGSTDLYLVRLMQTLKHFHDQRATLFPNVSKQRFNVGLGLIGFRALAAGFTDNKKLSSIFRKFLAKHVPVDPTYFFQNARNLERRVFETNFDTPIQPQELRDLALEIIQHMQDNLGAFSV